MNDDRAVVIAYAFLGIAILVGSAVLLISRPEPTQVTIIPPEPTATPSPTHTPEPVTAYVTGAVAEPETTISLPAGSRVEDALDAAGGTLENADMSRVNVAGLVRDGDHIHVFEESETAVVDTTLPTPGDGPVVYINSASVDELQTLPGIGPAFAERIIAYREANGPFTGLDDLQNVSGIGPATAEELTGLVAFE